jgi:hypothetical protein
MEEIQQEREVKSKSRSYENASACIQSSISWNPSSDVDG